MRDFWIGSGHHLLDRDGDGRLLLTDAFIKAYLARPELLPPEDACEAEMRLHHELLMHHPRRPVSAQEIAMIGDPDARENWSFMIAFRDRLIASETLEAACLSLARDPAGLPPLFLQQLTQVVLRNALDGSDDAVALRAAELFYRTQRATVHEGALLLADEEAIATHERDRHASPLLAMLGGPAVTELKILDPADPQPYFDRSDAFETVLDFGAGGKRGLASAMTAWIRHLLAIDVAIEPVERVEDEDWVWFVGLDAEATRIGNALWNREPQQGDEMDRIVGLFRLTFADPAEALPRIGARPVWLILAMGADRLVRMKPQNLVTGLPLRGPGGAH